MNILLAADILSLIRIPLGLLFVLAGSRIDLSLGVMVVAGVSDALDGWMARRARGPADTGPHRGDWLDPLCDKIFVTCVVVGLYRLRHPPLWLLVALLTREILQGIAMAFYRVVPSLRRRAFNFRAHPVGKAATVSQFLAGGLLLLGRLEAAPLAVLAAALGVLAVGIYVRRMFVGTTARTS